MFQIDDDGNLVQEDGTPVVIGETPVKVTNAVPQKKVDEAIKERLSRQDNVIKQLKATAEKTPEMERMIADLTAERDNLARQAATATQEAEQKVSQQFEAARKKAEQLENDLKQERTARMQDNLRVQILQTAGDLFVNPSLDIVPKLLATHKREPLVDDSGKKVDGQFVDLFELEYTDEDGKTKREALPMDRALEVLATEERYAHYVKPRGHSGTGVLPSGKLPGGLTGLRRSTMTLEQKLAVIAKHGHEGYQKLPE